MNRTIFSLLLVNALALPASAQTRAQFDWFSYDGHDPVYQQLRADSTQYYNPILPGFYPDPSICRAGDDYYLVTSSFAYFPGIPIFRSRDLVHWTQIGNVLNWPSQLSIDTLGISRGVFAPSISYHDGTFYVINTLADAGGNFLVTTKNPAGPWSNPIWLRFDGIDPSLFFDDDGKVWIINNGPPEGPPLYNGHRALWVQQYDPNTQQMIGPRTLVVNGGVDLSQKPIWIEAPHIFKVNGTYYLIAAEGGTAEQHSEVVFRGKSVLGPWEPFSGNPILTQRHLPADRPFPITSAGHADFVQTQNGEWWAVFLGARPYQDNFYNTGRETFMLPVTWREGWPHMLDGNATVPYVNKRPNLPPNVDAAAMKQGNFVERDDFTTKELAPYWTFMRTVRQRWYDLTTRPGWLTITPRPAGLGDRRHPSFVGRRQQHAYATATTAMQFAPTRAGEKAGLAAFQGDPNYYLLAVTLNGGSRVVQLEKSGRRGTTEVLASAAIATDNVQLRIEAKGDTYAFAYAAQPGKWTMLKDSVDGTFLSTRTAGGFVGTMFGMYAYAPPAQPAQGEQLPQVPLPGTQLRSLHSAQTGRDYDIYIGLPDNYARDTSRTYPVLYVLDGQWDFKLMQSVVGGLVYDRWMPPAIVVGITYSGVNADYELLRSMDYTPVADPRMRGTGDAPKFLSFLKSQVIPLIESKYRADPAQRVLMGSSFGGLFTLYALFAEPRLFSGYVAGSPSVAFGNSFSFAQEAAYARAHKDLPARVFIGVGGVEGLTADVKQFMDTVRTRSYQNLALETRVIEGERHSGNKPEAFNRALRFIFAK